jgi:hypothetical protein
MQSIHGHRSIYFFLFFFLNANVILTNLFSQNVLGATSKYENIARGKTYKFSPDPNYPLCADPNDIIQLTDGIFTSGYFWTQTATVGWQNKRPVIITIDLGKIEPILGVSYSTAAGVAGVTWPDSVDILVSDDGIHYFTVGDLITLSNKRDLPPVNGYAVHRYWIDSLRTHGRYVQLVIDPGGPFCFVDEIEIYRLENSWGTQQSIGTPTLGGLDFFWANVTNNAIKARLYLDLQKVGAEIKDSRLGEKENAELIAELKDIDNNIPAIMPVDHKSFSAVFPLNDLQVRIFSVLGKMRRMKGQSFLEAWVNHPLDYIEPTQNADSTSRKQIDLHMMLGEWRSAVFNLTNSSQGSIQIQFSIDGLPAGNNPDYVSTYEVQWTDTAEFKPIGAALKQIPSFKSVYSTSIPSGMTRQIWLMFHPVVILPGNYKGKINIHDSGGNKLEIPLNFRLFPVTFPERPTLHFGGWDYSDSNSLYGVTLKNREAFITHLQERFVDSPWATSRVMPFGSLGVKGDLIKKPDTEFFDSWIAHWPNARRYCVFLAVGDSLSYSKVNSEMFAIKVKSWIDFWVEHAISKGIKPEQLFLLLVDEPHENQQDKIIIAWAKAIHTAQPRIMLWENPTYPKPENALPEMMSSVNVLSPNRDQMLNEGGHFVNFYQKQKEEGRHLDLYSSKGPMFSLDPYSYTRLQAWICWELGAESTLFWGFSDTGGGNPWNPYISSEINYSPIFLAPDSVTPGKHMEALRESVEDFEYFVMLREAISKANPNNSTLPKAKELLETGISRVLKAKNASQLNWSNDKNRWIAEKVRVEILETLAALGYTGHDQSK